MSKKIKVAELTGALLEVKKRRDDPTYISWSHMMQRCYNANTEQFQYYGGRGIAVDQSWHEFAAFVKDMGTRPEGYTLDRIDTNGNYVPGNCRWADHQTQCSNRRSNVLVTWFGETRTLKQWADEIAVPYRTLWMRYKAGWAVDRMLSEPLNVRKSAAMRAYVASRFGTEVDEVPQ